MRQCHFVMAAVLLLAPGIATSQVYKCVGKDGKVQYTQTRPYQDDAQRQHTQDDARQAVARECG